MRNDTHWFSIIPSAFLYLSKTEKSIDSSLILYLCFLWFNHLNFLEFWFAFLTFIQYYQVVTYPLLSISKACLFIQKDLVFSHEVKIQFFYLQTNGHQISSANHSILTIFVELIAHIERIFFPAHLSLVSVEELYSTGLFTTIPDSQFVFRIILFSIGTFLSLLAVRGFWNLFYLFRFLKMTIIFSIQTFLDSLIIKICRFLNCLKKHSRVLFVNFIFMFVILLWNSFVVDFQILILLLFRFDFKFSLLKFLIVS